MFGNKMAAAECEFVFKLKSDLAPRKPYSRDEVLNAVESLHPGLELPDSTGLRGSRRPSVGSRQCVYSLDGNWQPTVLSGDR